MESWSGYKRQRARRDDKALKWVSEDSESHCGLSRQQHSVASRNVQSASVLLSPGTNLCDSYALIYPLVQSRLFCVLCSAPINNQQAATDFGLLKTGLNSDKKNKEIDGHYSN